MNGTAVPKIDRSKLREAIRKLGDELVFYLLDEALDLVPDARGRTLRRSCPQPRMSSLSFSFRFVMVTPAASTSTRRRQTSGCSPTSRW